MSAPALEPRSFDEGQPEMDTTPSFGTVASSALIHKVRWHTGLSQADFAAAYRIDPDHLRELERGLVQPDSVLVAYLTVIDRAPELVRAALTTC